jgi:MarR family transcriptional regulator for hemolysin
VLKRSDSAGFGTLLGETGRAWRYRLDQRLKPLGLSQAKWITLLKLSWADDGITQKELAERLCIESPTLVRLLDRMAADGWIERRGSDIDRRSKTVHLRRKSYALLQQINAVATRLSSDLLEGIPDAEMRSCMSVLRRIKEKALALDSMADLTQSPSCDCNTGPAQRTGGKRARKKRG